LRNFDVLARVKVETKFRTRDTIMGFETLKFRGKKDYGQGYYLYLMYYKQYVAIQHWEVFFLSFVVNYLLCMELQEISRN
jgi:hypothetical protein